MYRHVWAICISVAQQTSTWIETSDDVAMADLSAQPLWTGQLCLCEWLSVVWLIICERDVWCLIPTPDVFLSFCLWSSVLLTWRSPMHPKSSVVWSGWLQPVWISEYLGEPVSRRKKLGTYHQNHQNPVHRHTHTYTHILVYKYIYVYAYIYIYMQTWIDIYGNCTHLQIIFNSNTSRRFSGSYI